MLNLRKHNSEKGASGNHPIEFGSPQGATQDLIRLLDGCRRISPPFEVRDPRLDVRSSDRGDGPRAKPRDYMIPQQGVVSDTGRCAPVDSRSLDLFRPLSERRFSKFRTEVAAARAFLTSTSCMKRSASTLRLKLRARSLLSGSR